MSPHLQQSLERLGEPMNQLSSWRHFSFLPFLMARLLILANWQSRKFPRVQYNSIVDCLRTLLILECRKRSSRKWGLFSFLGPILDELIEVRLAKIDTTANVYDGYPSCVNQVLDSSFRKSRVFDCIWNRSQDTLRSSGFIWDLFWSFHGKSFG